MSEIEKLRQDLAILNALCDAITEDRDKYLRLSKAKEAVINMYKKDCEQFRAGHDRYEKLRKLNPREFSNLYEKNITGEGSFDELVDCLQRKW